MKRVVCLLLALLVLCGCGTNGTRSTGASTAQTTAATEPVPGQFQVGYSKHDITPWDSVPLAGYGNTSSRMSTDVADPLYATCVAITDPWGETVLLFGLDLTNAYSNVIPGIREKISEFTGVPVENIMISASHMHSGPDLGNTKEESAVRYCNLLDDWLEFAAYEALDDRKPAQMYTTVTETEGLNFVRRYVLENGTYAGDNYGDFDSSPIAGHETEADSALQLVKFVREEGQTVLLANFQTHPHRGSGRTNTSVTADLVGAFRDEIEAQLGYHVVYFTGASGNVNPTSRIKEENITEGYRRQGRALAAYAIAAESTYTQVQTGRVQTAQVTFVGQVNHSQDDLVPVATEISKVWSSTGDKELCLEMGAPYGINSPYHANSIITKSKMGETMEFDIFAVSVGDVAFAVAPYEMFDTNGMQIKEGSPFEMTFVLTCANSANSYIPSALGFEHGGYSADQCRMVAGTGELLVAEYLNMLETLYETK